MRTRHAAFTLLELLIVIMLVAVLAAMLIVAAGQSRARARSVQCINNLRQLSLGIRMYADANNGRFPGGMEEDPWFVEIGPFIGEEPTMFRCPSDPLDSQLSYGWRDESVCFPAASLAGKQIDFVAKSDLVAVFDERADWHTPNFLNVALVDAAALGMEEEEFEDNLLRSVDTGDFDFSEVPTSE